MKFETVNDYSSAIADYLCDEYAYMSKNLQRLSLELELHQLTEAQGNVVGGIINYCFDHNDSVNNAAHYLLEFLRGNGSLP